MLVVDDEESNGAAVFVDVAGIDVRMYIAERMGSPAITRGIRPYIYKQASASDERHVVNESLTGTRNYVGRSQASSHLPPLFERLLCLLRMWTDGR